MRSLLTSRTGGTNAIPIVATTAADASTTTTTTMTTATPAPTPIVHFSFNFDNVNNNNNEPITTTPAPANTPTNNATNNGLFIILICMFNVKIEEDEDDLELDYEPDTGEKTNIKISLFGVVFEEEDEYDFSKSEGLFVLQEFDEAIYFADCLQSKTLSFHLIYIYL